MSSPYVLVGLNHRTAPLELRERLAWSAEDLAQALADVRALPHVNEAMILSTCNRVEVLAFANGSVPNLAPVLAQRSEVSESELRKHLYEWRGDEAVKHVFRVAASLDSMVVGEPQILGQLKEAYAIARAQGCVQSYLDALLTRAFSVAKRVRTETAIGSSTVSIASVAVDLAKKIFGSLDGSVVHCIGAGKMIELAMRHLKAAGAGQVMVSNRTLARAEALASKFEGTAVPFEQLTETLWQADIVITSTGSHEPILTRQHGESFRHKRRNRPMFFIDIAVPRDVEPQMNKVEGMFVYDIDDLQQVVASNRADRTREAQRAEQIIAGEVQRFRERLHELDVVPTIVSLQDSMEMLRQAEIDRVRGRLGTLSPEQEQAIEALTRGIINKVLHTPITALKSAAKTQKSESIIDMVEHLFNLNQVLRRKKDSANA
ncbi:MAG TPA: glutamyl-tRNA reductase [Terriglobales bacterium]|jgi:glutamyl-tRNA reductase